MTSTRNDLLDFLRTLAIGGMVTYHTAYDLQYFFNWQLSVQTGNWKTFQICIASLFLLIVGYSAVLSYNKRYNTQPSILQQWNDQRKRILTIGGAALLISIATYIFNAQAYVRFGILHLIAVSTLLIPFIHPIRHGRIPLGIVLLALGPLVHTIRSSTSLLLPFGIMPASFASIDYYPLIPWFGVIIFGMGLAQFISLPTITVPRWLTWPGRRALLIYVVHQPIILLILHSWSIIQG